MEHHMEHKTLNSDVSPLISVIIPVYNVADYLGPCLDSVIRNTYKNLEIICINDGSTDNCLQILQDYSATDERIRVIDQPNGGVASARNAGLDIASGEWIAFVDSDDRVHSRFFELLLTFTLRESADMAVCTYEKVYTLTQTDRPVDPEKIETEILSLEECFRHNTKTEIWTHLYRRYLLENIHFEKRFIYSEDVAFNVLMLCARASLKTVFLHADLYYYYQRADSTLHTVDLYRGLLAFSDGLMSYLDHPLVLPQNRHLLLVEAIKEFLNYRYASGFLPGVDLKKREEIVHDRKHKLLQLLRTEKTSFKEWAVYSMLLRMPRLYRRYRISIDHTMLDWERMQKESRE